MYIPLSYCRRAPERLSYIFQEQLFNSTGVWIRLIPLFHCLSTTYQKRSRHGAHKHNSWWGMDWLDLPLSEMRKEASNNDPWVVNVSCCCNCCLVPSYHWCNTELQLVEKLSCPQNIKPMLLTASYVPGQSKLHVNVSSVINYHLTVKILNHWIPCFMLYHWTIDGPTSFCLY